MQAKNEGDRLVCANVYGLCWSLGLLARMECAALRSYLNVQPYQGFYTKQVFQSAGSDRCVISLFASRHGRNLKFRSRWAVDVGIAPAISKPGFRQASSTGQSGCGRHPTAAAGRLHSWRAPPTPCGPAYWPAPQWLHWDASAR